MDRITQLRAFNVWQSDFGLKRYLKFSRKELIPSQHVIRAVSDVLQNRSNCPNRSRESQRHDGY